MKDTTRLWSLDRDNGVAVASSVAAGGVSITPVCEHGRQPVFVIEVADPDRTHDVKDVMEVVRALLYATTVPAPDWEAQP